MIKRSFDIFVSALAILLFSPFFLLCAAAVSVFMGRPVLFKQKRAGLDSRPFELVKFRTMSDKRDRSGKLLPDADRLPEFGKWLRKTSLDELPELWNILRGDMSLVGPRPLHLHYLPRYTDFQSRRHQVRPGLTGWAQVNGRNSISWDERFALDVWYVENRSLLLDLKILAFTALRVVRQDGINCEGEATMGEFLGSPNDKDSMTQAAAPPLDMN